MVLRSASRSRWLENMRTRWDLRCTVHHSSVDCRSGVKVGEAKGSTYCYGAHEAQ